MTRASGFGELLTDQLRLMAQHFPDEPGYEDVSTGKSITFAEWDGESNRLARGLLDGGVKKGDRVVIYLPPEEPLEWVAAYSAAHKAGAVAVPTNTRLAPRELEYVLDHSGAVAAFAGSGTTDVLAKITRGELRWVATTVTPVPDWAVPWASLGDNGTDDASPIQLAVEPGDMADIMYTSGTTGRPKGVVVRHSNVAMVPNGLPRWSGHGWLHASPLFTFAGIACVYNPMKLGMSGMYQPRFDARAWMDVVERRRPTAAFLVPAMAQLLIAHPRFHQADLSSLSLVSLGSAPLAPETLRRLRERLPNAWVSNNWGMTEAGSAYCVLPPEEEGRRIGSVGKPSPPVVLRVVDEHGRDLPPGEIGELLVSNPGKEREYFNDPEATSRTWRDGWLHTGDLARLDEDGYLYIVGRMKDVIIRGGNNVHAGDVESAILEFPGVREAAVAGIPHDVLGEDVGAWVVPSRGSDLDVEKLRSFLSERLSDYKIPRQVTVVDELPRNATGKVLKDQLRSSQSQ